MDTEDEWTTKVPNWLVAIVGVALSAFVLWSVGGGYQQSHARNSNPRYTIGKVTGTNYAVGPSSHSVTFFTYVVGARTYRTSTSGDLSAGCTRCLIKYAADDPQNVKFYNHVCVPDSIDQAPAQGWKTPPFPVAANVE
ncbi:MAG: hypothetical protein EOO55_02695 [Hymenobacter sp.]|nr:MAG: hypothetical protein EOO55_02695 [Hymenobacter sp.]